MTTDTLPGNPRYCFAPIEGTEVGVQQMRIFVKGMDVSIGTSLIALTENHALAFAAKLYRPLGWPRKTWTTLRPANTVQAKHAPCPVMAPVPGRFLARRFHDQQVHCGSGRDYVSVSTSGSSLEMRSGMPT